MKKFLYLSLIVGFLSGFLSGCTENVRAKYYGGKMNVTLPPNTKLVNATFKDANLWYLYRPMRTNEQAETYHFVEKSSLGMMEGTITFTESK